MTFSCVTFYSGTEGWFPYVVLATFTFGIIHEIYFAIFAIYNFYVPRDIPQILKCGSITVTILIIFSQMSIVLLWVSQYKCNSVLYFTLESIFTILYGSCYVLLCTMFAIKVHASTRDSIYRLSKCFISYLYFLAGILILLVILFIIFNFFGNTVFELLCVCLAATITPTLYISLLIKLIKALLYVLKTTLILSVSQSKHVSYNDEINIRTNNINDIKLLLFRTLFAIGNHDIKQTTATKNNQTLALSVRNASSANSGDDQDCGTMDMDDQSMMKALGIGKIIVRLIVVVGVAFISGIMATVASLILYVETQDDASVGLKITLVYLCYIIDLKISNVCLLCQYGFSQKMFDKRCRLCTICFKHIVFCAFKAKLVSR